jgi:hypothetical protein
MKKLMKNLMAVCMYDIENLIITFGKHHQEVIEKRKRNLNQYPDNEYYEKVEDFDIAAALQAICEELKGLRNEVERLRSP